MEASLLRSAVLRDGLGLLRSSWKWGRLASAAATAGIAAFDPIQNYFRTADDRWVGVFRRDGRDEFAIVLKVLGMEHLASDERFRSHGARAKNVAAMVEALDEGFARLTLEEIGPRLTAADMVWGPLNYPRDTAEDPLAQAAGCFVDITDAERCPSSASPPPRPRFPGADDMARSAPRREAWPAHPRSAGGSRLCGRRDRPADRGRRSDLSSQGSRSSRRKPGPEQGRC